MEKPYVLYAPCIPVKGFKQSVIVDLHRQKIFHIPNSLYDLLYENKGKAVKEVKECYKNQYDEEITEYFDFLSQNDIVFFTENPNSFPELDLTWKSPFEITNCIIDIDKESNHNFKKLFEQLEGVSCPHIQIRCFAKKNIHFFASILDLLEDSKIISVELIIKYFAGIEKNELEKFVNKYSRIFNLILHSAPETTCITMHHEKMGNIFYSKKEISSPMDCGCISNYNFIINTKTLTESLNYNSCLNRKLSIDGNGIVKNCPAFKHGFGHIEEISLKETIHRKEFQTYWDINKDKMDVCSDCEYRYVCTDCRAILKNPNDIYSQPAKCNYNPFIAKWSDDEGYCNVEEWRAKN